MLWAICYVLLDKEISLKWIDLLIAINLASYCKWYTLSQFNLIQNGLFQIKLSMRRLAELQKFTKEINNT